ncbi:3-isopropylmalate dehydratase large subunit [Nymphon striatum]|nr:3-isopropylmalate dehydratase large subunit [Nymphon striatum]
MATQCLIQKKMKNMLVSVDGKVGPGVTAKDIVLAIIGEIGTAGGTGYAIEFAGETWDKAVEAWQDLKSDDDAEFDEIVRIHAGSIEPQVTWGTSPEMVLSVNAKVPDPAAEDDAVKSQGIASALEYMGLEAGIEDMREAASVVKGHKVADNVALAMVVPGVWFS